MTLLVTFFLISIFFSFLCSILEAVLLSITPAYVSIQEKESTRIAGQLAAYKEDIDRPLAAILSLNTAAHTGGAMGVGSQATVLFGNHPIEVFGLAMPIGWEAIIAFVMTLAILIFSEIIPKTLGHNNWEALTPFTVRALSVMCFILAPLVWLLLFSTRNLKKDKDRPVLSRSDFRVMAEIGKESGALEAKEHQIIHNLLRFSAVLVKDIMTPRIVVVSASETTTIGEFHQRHEDLPFSRIPIYKDQSDKITGYVLKDELLLNLVDDNANRQLSEIRRNIIIVHKSMPIPDLLDMFVHKKEHMALVVDEYGGMEGIVTMEDIIETLLGLEIVDESDSAEDMQALARKNWEQRAQRLGIVLPSEDH